MKQSLQLKLGQSLTMTPQLQQAIRLLQLSTMDLQQEIQQALDSNPMLEMDDEPPAAKSSSDSDINSIADTPPTQGSDVDFSADSGSSSNDNDYQDNNSAPDSDWNDSIPTDLSTDSSWEDTYQSTSLSTSNNMMGDDNDFDFDSKNSAQDTLEDHLLWQLNLTPMSDTDRIIAMAIIDAVDANGFLTLSPEDIWLSLCDDSDLELPEDERLELDEIEAVRHRIQQFDPIGVASVDLRDCLMVQLAQVADRTPGLIDAKVVVDKYLPLLGNRDFAQLMRKAKLKESQLKLAIDLIQTLNPRPGDIIDTSDTEYIAPDVFVSKNEGDWFVSLNPEISPKIKINDAYAKLIKRADSSTDNTYLKDNLQEARWFLKSLQSRNETLLKVASCIVDYQRGFFDYGDEAMKPLVLHDIADAVDMHESTISRVTTRKYMHTPRGIFELKYFFSSHVSTSSGGECSSTAIRALIKKLVAAENPKKPLSDSKITALLEEQGIKVARRTIAKYREALSIPPSNERKQLV